MSRWDVRRDELDRTTFDGQLDIEGGVQVGDVVVPKKRAVRSVEGTDRAAPSIAGHEGPGLYEDRDTP